MGDDTFGVLLRRYRLTAGLSQEELAERAGLSVRGIGDLERGRRTAPRPHTVAMLADGLGIEGEDRRRLFEHARPGIVRSHPPARPAPSLASRSAVPIPPIRMLGREDLAANLITLLARRDVRLLTLTGPGGVGKTLLATSVARRVANRFPDGAIFVELASVDHSEAVGPAILHALGARDQPPGNTIRQVQDAVRDLDALLLLDNCEHVLDAMPLVASMLATAPRLAVLATSRERLHLRGEREIVVPPLSLPPRRPERDPEPPELAGSSAIRLFIERAEEARPGFAMSKGNASAILGICERLDALPLAIELAAARVRHLSPSDILKKLDERLLELGDGPRDAPERHRAMSATVSWSYDLLAPPDKAVFRHIAVFVGGFDLAAAEAVTSDGVFGKLGSLIDKGLLLHTTHDDGQSRFTMLETIRAFGLERLTAHGEEARVRDEHARYFLHLAEGLEATLHEDPSDSAIDHFDRETGNLHAALDWAIRQHDKTSALRLASALWPFWRRRYYSGIGRATFGRALALDSEVAPAVEARALLGAGSLEWVHGEYDLAEAHIERALSLSHELGDLSAAGEAELALGRLSWDRGMQDVAREHFTRAMRQFTSDNDRIRLAQALHGLGLVFYQDGHHDRSRASFLAALELWSSHGLSWGLACCIPGHLGDVARAAGDIQGAIVHYQDCIDRNWVRRDYENVAWCCIGLATTLSTADSAEDVAWLLGVADRVQDIVQEPFMPDVARMYNQASGFATNALGPARFHAIRQVGRDGDPDSSVTKAVTLGDKSPPSGQTL